MEWTTRWTTPTSVGTLLSQVGQSTAFLTNSRSTVTSRSSRTERRRPSGTVEGKSSGSLNKNRRGLKRHGNEDYREGLITRVLRWNLPRRGAAKLGVGGSPEQHRGPKWDSVNTISFYPVHIRISVLLQVLPHQEILERHCQDQGDGTPLRHHSTARTSTLRWLAAAGSWASTWLTDWTGWPTVMPLSKRGRLHLTLSPLRFWGQVRMPSLCQKNDYFRSQSPTHTHKCGW